MTDYGNIALLIMAVAIVIIIGVSAKTRVGR